MRGLYTEGYLRFKIDWASLIVGSKCTIFALFWRGDLTEGFLRYWFGGLTYDLEGLIHGGAYFWKFTVSLYPCFDVIIVIILFNFQVNRVP